MTPTARWTTGLLVVVVVISLGYLGARGTPRAESDLMRGVQITAGQLPAMEAALAKAKLTGYEIRGTSIFVPRGQEAMYMAALADANALPPNFGDILTNAVNDGGPFMSSQQRAERIKNAKQRELSLIIRSFNGIENAFVLYDEDKKPGFKKDKLITATVSVKPSGSVQLDEARVAAFRHLVAGAIAGLKPEDVTVSDLNGRTWYGNTETGGGKDEYRYITLRRTYEQDLKAKILNSLGFIPNVTVEPCVTLDREEMTPVSARVSVGVPISYFKKIWRERQTEALGQTSGTPDPAVLERIRLEETAKIERHVAQLLPSAQAREDLAELVAVTPFEDVQTHDAPPAGFGQDALLWLGQSWRAIGLIGLALVCLLVLRSIVRGASPGARRSTTWTAYDDDKDSARAKPSSVPAPHWLRQKDSSDQSSLEELSKLIDNDPETAANVLRNWIG